MKSIFPLKLSGNVRHVILAFLKTSISNNLNDPRQHSVPVTTNWSKLLKQGKQVDSKLVKPVYS